MNIKMHTPPELMELGFENNSFIKLLHHSTNQFLKIFIRFNI
jgi:hypothetical protein